MKRFGEFCANEEGSVSLWNLFWLIGLCLLLGLAIDVSTAMHTKARLQTVADTSSHAGVVELAPDEGAGVTAALTYSATNMPEYADVVKNSNITTGWWDYKTQTFDTNSPPAVNAVRVVATRDKARANATATSFLGLVGFYGWDINAVSIASSLELEQLGCPSNGLFAGGQMEKTSNNTIVAPFCEYGHTSFKISQNNLIMCGVQQITPTPENFKNGTPPVPTEGPCNENYAGLTSEEMLAQAMIYDTMPVVADLEYANAKAVLQKFISGQTYNDPYRVIPPWMVYVDTVSINTFNSDAKGGRLQPGTLYVVSCAGSNKRMEIEGFLQNVGIYTDCEIRVNKDQKVSDTKPTKTETRTHLTKNKGQAKKQEDLCDPDVNTCEDVPWLSEITDGYWSCAGAIAAGFEPYTTYPDTAGMGKYRDGTTDADGQNCGIEPGANGLWDNVLIFTTYLEGGNVDQKAMTFPNNMQLGRIDGCTEGGGVRIYSAGSIHTPSGTTAHGLQVVTLGSVHMAAKANGVMGIHVQAMGDIKYTANGMMGGCPSDAASGASEVVVTVRPIALVQ